jgi:hypothetical protein
MIVVLTVAIICLVAGTLAGGSVRNFERIHVYWWGAAATGLVLQLVPFDRWLDDDVAVAALVGSYALLIAFVWVKTTPGAPCSCWADLNMAATASTADAREPAAISAAGGPSGAARRSMTEAPPMKRRRLTRSGRDRFSTDLDRAVDRRRVPLCRHRGVHRDRHAGTLRGKSSSPRVDPDVSGEAPPS